MSSALQVCAFLMLTSAATAETPADVTFTLATKSGQTAFRIGEPVDVELRFRASTPGRYQVTTLLDKRVVRTSLFDHFAAEPEAGAVDPLRDLPAQMVAGGSLAAGRSMCALGTDTVVIERQLNEWISFREPGRYRITAETTRVRLAGGAGASVALRSNTIEIHIVAPEPGWETVQLREAVAVLSRGDLPAPVTDQPVDETHDRDATRAARVLRFLDTPDAAWALARFFEHGPRKVQEDIRAGLFGSPHRIEVIAAMESLLADPDMPVTHHWIGTLIDLAVAPVLPPQDPFPSEDRELQKRWAEAHERYLNQAKPVKERYFGRLAEALASKRGQAWTVSLQTLFLHGPKPAPAPVLTALLGDFRALSPVSRRTLLRNEWHRIASPALEPLVHSLAEDSGPDRDEALMRLQELNPEAARKLLLDRIRRGDTERDARVLMTLPDKTLPELEDALVDALEQGKPVQPLVARYASRNVFSRVQAWYEGQTSAKCGGLIFAYFFRVDPAYATVRLAEERKTKPGECPLYMSPYDDLLMSPGLERAAVEDLADPSPFVRRAAETLLQDGGSDQAEQPLWDALAKIQGAGLDEIRQGAGAGLVEVLLKASGWVLTPEKLDRLQLACPTDELRRWVVSQRRSLKPPVRIHLIPLEFWSVVIGPFRLCSPVQAESKIRQFPRGTTFQFTDSFRGTWFGEQRTREIQRMLDAAGMRVEDTPPETRSGRSN